MATRGRTTFQKKQKESARKERQQRKAERREHRKLTRFVEENMPPQDSETSAEHQGFTLADQSEGWQHMLRSHSK